jgi:hypothetical protein
VVVDPATVGGRGALRTTFVLRWFAAVGHDADQTYSTVYGGIESCELDDDELRLRFTVSAIPRPAGVVSPMLRDGV